jgi:hypothetical protein
VTRLQCDLDALHDNVFEHFKNNVERRQGHAVHIPNLAIGDLVLKFRRKLLANWAGPYRIIDTVNDYVYKIQDLLHKSY